MRADGRRSAGFASFLTASYKLSRRRAASSGGACEESRPESSEAFETEGKLANDLEAGHRYRAVAVLAGVGQGRDAGTLTNEAKAALRQALDWLKADLAVWRNPREGSQRAGTLRKWRTEPALAKLPQIERAAWHALWVEAEKP